MANTHVFETKLSNRMQITRYSTPVFTAQASFEERSNLTNGQAVNRPTFSRFYAEDYTRGTDMSEQGMTEGSETLTIDQTPGLLVRVDDFDEIQHKASIMDRVSKDGVRAVSKVVDGAYLAEVANATSTVDDADFGGTSGVGITLDSSNVLDILHVARRKLQLQDVEITGLTDQRASVGNMKPMGSAGFADFNPYVSEKLFKALANRETADGDMVGKNGYRASHAGFDIFETTNGYWTGVLALATQPTDGDTVVIHGITFTFKTTLGSTAGNVLIGASADAARANLAALINAPETTTAQGVALSATNILKLARFTATNDDTANTLTVTAKGVGYVVVDETLTATADTWSSEISSQMVGQKGAVDMVMQDAIKVKVSDIPKQHGAYVKPRCLYGIKTFTEGAQALVNVKINSASWV